MKDWGFDISELEGNHVVYSSGDGEGGRDTQIGRVVGCEPDVGITIVALGDPDDYLVCLPMDGIPGYDDLTPACKSVATMSFEVIVDGIISGCINTDQIEALIDKFYVEHEDDLGRYATALMVITVHSDNKRSIN